MNSLIQLRKATPLFLVFVLACFALCPMARAVDPPPDGGYPNENTAEGEDALFSVTTLGGANTAVGFHALYNNTDGWGNTAIGDDALSSNISVDGQRNTATGASALENSISGNGNTAIGYLALWKNITGSSITAIGEGALAQNSTGNFNTAVGDGALGGCGFPPIFVIGDNNAATGFFSALVRYHRQQQHGQWIVRSPWQYNGQQQHSRWRFHTL